MNNVNKNKRLGIYKAGVNDTNDILRLMRGLIAEHHQRDRYYKPFSKYRGLKKYILDSLKDKNKLTLVVKNKNGVVAYLVAAIEEAPFYSSEKDIGVIADAAVNKVYRRRGILTMMFKYAEEWFRRQGIKYLELSVNSKNQTAIAAWQKLGFRVYKLRMRKKL